MSSGSRRGWGLAGVLALGATALWAVALLRLRQQVEARPGRERFLTWVTADGPLGRNPSYPHCNGPAIVAIDRAWRTCYHSYSGDPDQHFVVRFELDRKRAVMMPLPGDVDAAWPTAAAVSPDGALALIIDGIVVSIVGDQATWLGLAGDHEVAGIAWVDGAVEVVRGYVDPEVIRFGKTTSRRPLPRPPVDEAGERSPWMIQAWRGPAGWHLLYVMHYLGIDRAPRPDIELIEGDERGEAWTSTRVPKDPDRDEVSLDGARAGLLAWSSADWRWHLVRDGAGWRRFEHPQPAAAEEYEQLVAHYRIGADGLTAMHRLNHSLTGLAETPAGWIGLGYEYDGTHDYLRLFDLAGQRGPRAVGWGWIDDRAVLVPASAGGWWLLGAFGTYIRVDGLHRLDAPDALGRIHEMHGSFDRLGMYNDWYGDSVALKRAAIPVVLLGWPVAALAALLSWLLLRRRRVPLSTPLAITMSIYGAVALMLIKTFWDVTSRL